MKLVLSLSALGLIAGGATAVTTQSSCTTSNNTCINTLAATPAVACTSAMPVEVSVAAPRAQGDKVAARAAQLEALAGDAATPAPEEDGQHSAPRVFRYEDGKLAPVAPRSRARVPSAPAAPSAPRAFKPNSVAPSAPAKACEPCPPCPPTPPCEPAEGCAPAEPAAPSRAKVRGSVTLAPQQRAELERQLSQAGEHHERARTEMRRALEHHRVNAQQVRAEAERARERATAEAKRAHEHAAQLATRARRQAEAGAERAKEAAKRASIVVRERTRADGAHGGGSAGSTAGSARERELEKRVAELEARLAEMEHARSAGVDTTAPAQSGPNSMPGPVRFRALTPTPGADGGATFYRFTPQSDDPECSPTRVRIFRTSPGQNTVVIQGDTAELAQLETLDELRTLGYAEVTPEGEGGEWSEDLAEWAEDFAREQAEWAEEFAEHHAEGWKEALEEQMEAFEEAWDAGCEALEDELEAAEEAADEDDEEARDDADEAAEDADARTAPLLFGAGQSVVRTPLAARSLFGEQDPFANLLLTSNSPGVPAEQLRSAVNEMQAEVDGLRAALRELREQLERRKSDDLR